MFGPCTHSNWAKMSKTSFPALRLDNRESRPIEFRFRSRSRSRSLRPTNKVIAPVVDQLVGGRNVFNGKINVNGPKLIIFFF